MKLTRSLPPMNNRSSLIAAGALVVALVLVGLASAATLGPRLRSAPAQDVPAQVVQVPAAEEAPVVPPVEKAPERAPAPTEPMLVLSRDAILSQGAVSVQAQGFAPGEEIRVEMVDKDGRLAKEIGTGKADASGSLSDLKLDIPLGTIPGRYTVTATGAASGKTATSNLSLLGSAPLVTTERYTGRPYSRVDFAGVGFAPGESVKVYFDSTNGEPAAAAQADGQGILRVTDIEIPFVANGDHAFIFEGANSRAPVRVGFSVVTYHPWVIMGTYAVTPGQTVDFHGYDFAPMEEVRVYLNNLRGQPVATLQADRDGKFDANAFKMPAEVTGKNMFYFAGEKSKEVTKAEVEVVTTATIPY